MIRTLTENDVRRLEPLLLIEAIEQAFRDRYPAVVIPPRNHISTAAGVLLTMPCYDPSSDACGLKLVTVHTNPTSAEDRIRATYMLLDAANGCPQVIISANYLTDLRTAATSAVATRHLAQAEARTLGIFGTGRQARAHLEVLSHVRHFDRILVCGTDIQKSRSFAENMQRTVGFSVVVVNAATCAAESDVICTCTTSRSPLFDGSLLRPGTHLNVVGAFQPDAREVDDKTVQLAQVVVDTYEGALAEAGDILIPISRGVITRSHVKADLHQLVSGKRTVRTSRSDITLFKSVGCALEDLVTAELAERLGAS